MEMKKSLIIAAHPDDDILGCGGVMARFSETVEFRVIYIAEGVTCRLPSCDETDRAAIDTRNKFAKLALESLGIDNYMFNNLPCGRLDKLPLIDIAKLIEREIDTFLPDTVFTHSPIDVHNDHRVVYQAVIQATRPCNGCQVKQVYSYEVLSSTEWQFDKVFIPTTFISLDANWARAKIDALTIYKDELRSHPHPRSTVGLESQLKLRGSQCGSRYAEAFSLIREIT